MARRWGSGFVLVHRAELQQLLAAELDAVIHLGACCTGFEDSGQAVIARFADRRRFRLMSSSADGCTRPCGPSCSGLLRFDTASYTAVRSPDTRGIGVRFHATVPKPGAGARWTTWGLPPATGSSGTRCGMPRWEGRTTATPQRSCASSSGPWHDPIPAIIEATPKTTLIRNDISDRWPTRTWGRGRVALGDAIHPMTPDLAQGACQAIVDAAALATCLAASRDTRAALRQYQQRRWRNAATTTLIARNTGAMGQWKGRLTCAARDAHDAGTPLSLASPSVYDVVLRPRQVSGQRRTS